MGYSYNFLALHVGNDVGVSLPFLPAKQQVGIGTGKAVVIWLSQEEKNYLFFSFPIVQSMLFTPGHCWALLQET